MSKSRSTPERNSGAITDRERRQWRSTRVHVEQADRISPTEQVRAYCDWALQRGLQTVHCYRFDLDKDNVSRRSALLMTRLPGHIDVVALTEEQQADYA